MSHTTEISSIVFSDIVALESAVRELSERGVRCSLKRNVAPRAYFKNQAGLGVADLVLELQDCAYDVGFYKSTTGKGYIARCDLFANSISNVLGVPLTANSKIKPEQAALGKLYRTYAAHATMRQSVAKGYKVRRVDAADGSIKLIIAGM